MKGRIELFFIAALACQSLHVTSLMAADQTGVASVYSTESGSKTASGEKLNPEALIAAHRTLPFGTKATVRNKRAQDANVAGEVPAIAQLLSVRVGTIEVAGEELSAEASTINSPASPGLTRSFSLPPWRTTRTRE